MFVLRNVGKLFFGPNTQESLIELPQGQLYLVRPLSPKGYSELIFKDSAIRIRRTNQDFHYQLVVQRAFEEGEAELLADEEGGDAELDSLATERDEKTFLLDEALHFCVDTRHSGESVLAWGDLSGDRGDVYEFVCDSQVSSAQVEAFVRVARECQYERKYRKPHTTASAHDLAQFHFQGDQSIPPASPIQRPAASRRLDSVDNMYNPKPAANSPAKRETPAGSTPHLQAKSLDGTHSSPRSSEPDAPPPPISIYVTLPAELHLFDPQPGHFVLIDDSVIATVSEIGQWEYWLQIDAEDKSWLGAPVVAEFNPVFDFEFLSFVFNHFGSDGTARSWLLRFKDQPALEKFQEAVMQAIWERLNETKWAKIKDKEREYVLDSFAGLNLEDEEEEEEEEEDEGRQDDTLRSQDYDDSEEDDDETAEARRKDGEVNSQLAVGYKHDRSFVVRGSKIGVFSHTPDNRLKFSTNISKVMTPKGKLMSPKKVMLHSEDRDLILQNDVDPTKLYRMDIEHGKVVDEWNVHDNIPVVTFAPENKFAQMTSEQTFLGVSNNALYRIDPRLSGNKLVESDMKQYASKNDFSALATPEKGYIAVASNKGDIRLFDRLGIRAKTQLPALGDPIIGMDVSADGRWILGTTKNYLLLVDAQQQGGKNDGKLGFEKSFAADAKPRPRRLALTPEHVAQFFHETGKPITFTPAKFNRGEGKEETSIITATGPYIIEWNLRRVLRGTKPGYRIKRYEEEVKADDFKFGSDKNVIVALPNEVNMVARQSLRKPTRESIIGDLRLSGGRASGSSSTRIGTRDSGRYKLGKDDIVHAPY